MACPPQLSRARADLVLTRSDAPCATHLAVLTRDLPPTAGRLVALAGERLLLSDTLHVSTAGMPALILELQQQSQRLRHPRLLTCVCAFQWDTRGDSRDLTSAMLLAVSDAPPPRQRERERAAAMQPQCLGRPCRLIGTVWADADGLRSARASDVHSPTHWSSLRRAASWLIDVAEALRFLKSEDAPHGSVRYENVVVGADGHARLAHFDWLRGRECDARCCDRAPTKLDRHAAPELFRQTIESGRRASSFAGDVYGFGMLAIELATGEPPFGLLSDEEIEAIVTGDADLGVEVRPDDRKVISDAEWRLVSLSLARDPDARPPIEDVVDMFVAIARGQAERFAASYGG